CWLIIMIGGKWLPFMMIYWQKLCQPREFYCPIALVKTMDFSSRLSVAAYFVIPAQARMTANGLFVALMMLI
ncbi:MAG: hypothetical protein KAH12_06700, partial [Anaerolineales bacterium]|nr:hypothetical protein [Anaerolineales bacterium]